MASRIQIARGQLSTFRQSDEINKDAPFEGELFWQARNVGNNESVPGVEYDNRAYDEGTLYIGRPSLKREGQKSLPEAPIPIAGARTYQSLVYRGGLSLDDIADIIYNTPGNKFETVRNGDFFIINRDVNDEKLGLFSSSNDYATRFPTIVEDDNNSRYGFKSVDFRKNDILLITEAKWDTVNSGVREGVHPGKSYDVSFTKIDCSGGDAYQTRFKNKDEKALLNEPTNDFSSNDVQSALEELEYEKLSYRGILSTQEQVSNLRPEIGSLYLTIKDGLTFNNGKNSDGSVRENNPTKKGDFVYWINNEYGWVVIPSGYTDAQDIDFDPTEARAQQEKVGTFDDKHKKATEELSDVKSALDFLLSKKAQLDDSGKVPLSQLHDTVLGAMQYMGTWNPLVDDNTAGIDNPEFQNPWPLGKDDESGEVGPHNGDYYIVQTSGINVKYRDKESKTDIGGYDRIIELNSGDWIVYSSSPINSDGHNSKTNTDGSNINANTDGNPLPIDPDISDSPVKYHWAKIDNSDRITQINFTINGVNTPSGALPTDPHDTYRIGTPTIASSDKILLYDNNGVITVAGARLVSQFSTNKDNIENGIANFIPKYVTEKNGDTTLENVIKNSSIENKYKEATEADITIFHSDVSVGSINETMKTQVHGDIIIFPHLGRKSSTDVNDFDTEDLTSGNSKPYYDTKIKFLSAVDQTETTTFKNLTIELDPKFENDSRVFLPNKSSDIIGKLAGVELIKGRITKSTENGFIDSSSLEEHMKEGAPTDEYGQPKYSDDFVATLESHAPHFTVNNANVRHIIFGQKSQLNDLLPNGGSFVDGRLVESEKEFLTHIYSNSKLTSSIEVFLPANSGTLITDKDLKDQLDGTEKKLPIYGPDIQIGDTTCSTLIDSHIEQTANALFNTISKTASKLNSYNKEFNLQYNGSIKRDDNGDPIWKTDENGNILYEDDGTPIPESLTDEKLIQANEDVVVNSNMVIGELSQDEYGHKYVSKPKSVLITGEAILGNPATNTTIINSERTMLNDSQYRNPYTEETLKYSEVMVDLPSASGVLLTSNSRVDGGYFG